MHPRRGTRCSSPPPRSCPSTCARLVQDDSCRQRAHGQAGAEPVEPHARREMHHACADEKPEPDERRKVEAEVARVREGRIGRIRDVLQRGRPVDVAHRPQQHPQPDQHPGCTLAAAESARETGQRCGQADAVVDPVREEAAHGRPAEACFELDGEQREDEGGRDEADPGQAEPPRRRRPRQQGAFGRRVTHIHQRFDSRGPEQQRRITRSSDPRSAEPG